MAGTIGVQFSLGATLARTVASAFGTVGSRIRGLRTELRGLETASSAAQRMSRTRAELLRARDAHRAGPTAETAAELERTRRAYRAAAESARRYGLSVRDLANHETILRERIERTRTALQRQQQLQANQAKRQELQSQVMGTVASVMAVAVPFKLSIDFESSMANVKKVTNFDAPGFTQFKKDLLNLTETIPVSATGLAEIAESAGAAGIKGEELLRFSKDAAVMAVAFDITAKEAGSAMTGLRTNFKLSQDGVMQLGDAINAVSNSMDAKAGDIVNFANSVGGTASIYKFTGQEMAALGGVFKDAKVDVEAAGTATNFMLTRLGTADKASKEAQEAFRSVGLTGKGLAAAFQKDAQGALLLFLRQVKASKDPMRVLNAALGADHAPKVARLLNSLDKYEQTLAMVSDAKNYAGAIDKEYEERSKTTANAIQLASNKLSRLGITIGSVMLPAIVSVLETVGPYITAMADFVEQHQTATAVVLGVATALVAFKVSALVGMYAATILSDAWQLAGNVLHFFRPSVLMANIALKVQQAQALLTSAAIRIMTIGSKLAAAGQWILNAAFLACPLTWIIGGLVALGAGMIYLYNTCEPVRTALNGLWETARTVAAPLLAALIFPFVLAFDIMKMVFTTVSEWIRANWQTISTGASQAWSTVSQLAVAAWTSITGVWSGITGFFAEHFGGLASLSGTVWSGISSSICGVWDGVKAKASEIFDWLAGKFEWLNTASNMFSTSWSKAKSWVGMGDDKETKPAPGTTVMQPKATPPVKTTDTTAWYDPRGWFSSRSETAPVLTAQAAPQTTVAVTAPSPATEAPGAEKRSAQSPGRQATTEQDVLSRLTGGLSGQGGQGVGDPSLASLGTLPSSAPVQLTQTFTLQGVTDGPFAERVVSAVKARRGDFESLISEIVNDQMRLSYGG